VPTWRTIIAILPSSSSSSSVTQSYSWSTSFFFLLEIHRPTLRLCGILCLFFFFLIFFKSKKFVELAVLQINKPCIKSDERKPNKELTWLIEILQVNWKTLKKNLWHKYAIIYNHLFLHIFCHWFYCKLYVLLDL